MRNDDVHIVKELDKFSSVTHAILAQGLTFTYKILICEVQEANRRISKQLGLSLASKVFCLKKVRIVEGKPRSIETTYVDYRKVPGIETADFSNQSFYDKIKQDYGLESTKSEEEIFIVDANASEKELLELAEDETEVLMIKGKAYTEDDVAPLECFELIALPSFYHFRSVSAYE
ncbi:MULTISPECIES: UTRA domain-containing protein [Breznakia]|uniref:UTRA domain-containing protein n=1 Tax=Breznakia blatticola TaxID=1754012 RepID=A0A4R8A6W6_9FIRM|nr:MULTISPECIES: UTRA domain-containing protein [Breznakia]MDH6366014.1 DNA-binding GntR family transcriptional regulator [Breznakia sp. PH1-1]MDH6403054.1 DNA-binding GntR family transcriptional regulator [Breznakia sp. PF1-11]MDH6410763.1 DNA-binding GntR family transcriptional regulator [Breznakia sp. PFB1-11]MDH6413180.1 DNA-binding GntR family transcriptional regulator [Breznakia sp. PFB1-14]MDH6415548.1 DNA-binding GntR family transcriptional regulator [Breznakia sp. PFB1-4]